MAKNNNGAYTGKNCKFSDFKGVTTGEELSSKLQEELGVTFVLIGKYELLIHTTKPTYIKAIRVGDDTPGTEQFTLKCVLPDNVDPEYFKFKVKNGDKDIEHDDPGSVTVSDSGTIQTITEIAIGEKTAHKVYNSYQWNNIIDDNVVHLTATNSRAENLVKIGEEEGIEIRISGHSKWDRSGRGLSMSKDFQISVNLKTKPDLRFYLETIAGMKHLASIDSEGGATITITDSVIVTKLVLGRIQHESYGPYGCGLIRDKIKDSVNEVQIEQDSDYNLLKRYSIPKFCVNDRSITGYGWYRQAKRAELLIDGNGYQTAKDLKPFGTNKAKQMLFLTTQLRDPGLTILYDGGDGGNKTAQELKATCQIQDGKVLINNDPVYTLETGDVLVRYSVSDELISKNNSAIYGPYGVTARKSGNYIPAAIEPRRPLGSSAFYVDNNTANPYALATLSIYSQETLLSVAYDCSLPGVTITELTPQGEQAPTNELDQLYRIPLKYSTGNAQTTHILSSPTAMTTYKSSNIAGGRYQVQSTLSFNLQVNITNIPAFAKTGTPGIDSFVSLNPNLTCKDGPLARHDSVDLVYAGDDYCSVSCALFEQWGFPVIHTQTFSSVDSNVLGYDFHASFGPCAGIIPNTEDFHPTSQYYPGEETNRIFRPNIFSLYVVGHFVTPPDQITEGTDNGDSMPNAIPH